MSSTEMLVIAAVILILFGGRRLPEIARLWGRTLRELRRNLERFKREAGLDFDINAPDDRPPRIPPNVNPHRFNQVNQPPADESQSKSEKRLDDTPN